MYRKSKKDATKEVIHEEIDKNCENYWIHKGNGAPHKVFGVYNKDHILHRTAQKYIQMEGLKAFTRQQRAKCVTWYCQTWPITQFHEVSVLSTQKVHLLRTLLYDGLKSSKNMIG